jgi:hypothetical protein
MKHGIGKTAALIALASMATSINGNAWDVKTERATSYKDLSKPRIKHPSKKNSNLNKMSRGGHTFIFGHPNAYKG